MSKMYGVLFFLLIIFLCFLSFYPAFSFAFIVDDWYQLWGVFYDRSVIDYYIKTQHPNSAYEFLILAPIFKFTPVYYQIVGFVLKIINSLMVSFIVLSITNSKKAAFFSGLIFAASVMGVETYTRISAQNSALLIPTLSLGLYFWIKATKESSFYRYVLAIVFILVTIMGDPGVGIMILPIAFLWSLLNFLQSPSKNRFKKILITSSILIAIPIVLKWYLDSSISNRSSYLSKHLAFLLSNSFIVVGNFLTSLGNLLVGWIIPIQENMGLTSPSFITNIVGNIFIAIMFWLVYLFIKNKTDFYRILIFFSIWIFLFYFPSWFTQTHYVEGGVISSVSNRYFAISSIGVIGLIGYGLTFLKKNLAFFCLGVVIVANLWSSNRILNEESKYRSTQVQEKLYNAINKDLAKGKEQEKLLLFLGDNWLRIIGIEWNGFYPIAVKRGIANKAEFPAIINNLQSAKDLLCSSDKYVRSKYPLSNFYAWQVEDGEIYNVSENAKKIITSDEKCSYNEN